MNDAAARERLSIAMASLGMSNAAEAIAAETIRLARQ